MKEKEFKEKFQVCFARGVADMDIIWQWIEEYGKQERIDERKEIIKKINLRADKYVYRD